MDRLLPRTAQIIMDTKDSFSSLVSDQDSNDVLYSDEYFTLTKTNLIIKNYYSIIATPKTIPLENIVSIHTTKELDLKWYEKKMVSKNFFFFC
jgi:hypothetical protein